MSAVVDWLIAVCVTIHTGRPPLRDHARHAQFNQEKFVRKISPWHVNRGAWAHRPHYRSVVPVDAETDVSRPGRQHPRLPSLGIPSILGRAQPPQPPTKPDRCTRAIEAFSNFRSVEAPGWTGGIRFQRRRLDARTSVQWKPLLTTTCAWQLSLSLSLCPGASTTSTPQATWFPAKGSFGFCWDKMHLRLFISIGFLSVDYQCDGLLRITTASTPRR